MPTTRFPRCEHPQSRADYGQVRPNQRCTRLVPKSAFSAATVSEGPSSAPRGAWIVLCLHDELLVQTPTENGAEIAQLVNDCLQEAAHRWAPDDSVRFVAETSVIHRWSDAKD